MTYCAVISGSAATSFCSSHAPIFFPNAAAAASSSSFSSAAPAPRLIFESRAEQLQLRVNRGWSPFPDPHRSQSHLYSIVAGWVGFA